MAGLSFSDEYAEMLRLLRSARKAAGLTQADVARSFGMTQGAISKIENGELRIDPIELQRFAALYGVEVGALLPGRQEDARPTTAPAKEGQSYTASDTNE